MTTMVLAAAHWDKEYFQRDVKFRIAATGELTHREGNPRPYFSITGQVQEQRKNYHWADVSAGAIHEEILEAFPGLEPLVKVHLSDDLGVPMHAYSNAAYFAGCYGEAIQLEKLANHLRVAKAEAIVLCGIAAVRPRNTDPVTAWHYVCKNANLPERWKREAEYALALLEVASRI